MAVSSVASIVEFMVKISPLPINMAVSSGVSIFAFVVKISPLPIDSFHIVSAHASNSLVPCYLREITLEGATFIRLPMHYTIEYEKR